MSITIATTKPPNALAVMLMESPRQNMQHKNSGWGRASSSVEKRSHGYGSSLNSLAFNVLIYLLIMKITNFVQIL